MSRNVAGMNHSGTCIITEIQWSCSPLSKNNRERATKLQLSKPLSNQSPSPAKFIWDQFSILMVQATELLSDQYPQTVALTKGPGYRLGVSNHRISPAHFNTGVEATVVNQLSEPIL